ncbi:hypothetical protein CH64_3423 [Yersinia rohdei]|uniref:ShET2 enterotoxin N-terminal domain-containing protein n=2 Tax=Yersinia rohdei TaxID=29485 RepID=A0ABN4F2E4_YERRO|nr:ShET2/EspL2 family type III secretion system effector toxin [Yersinia rohdei]AJJ10967.1 hypothetical protein CH64_3423 [Yersinia rohdei]EEQ03488.1 ShET2 enterotoxin domain protein [Yersinia rohdei ATCC 43380]
MKVGGLGFPVYNNKIKNKSQEEKEIFKRIPYLSIKHGGSIRNDNCKFNFREDDGNQIVCRHLAAQYALDVLNNMVRGKVKMSYFATPKSIQNHVTSEVELYYKEIIEKSQTVYLIDNNDFGRMLVDIFQTMESHGETHLALFLANYYHAMAVRLSIKRDNRLYYVINFYDPNVTNHTIRCKVYDLSLLETHTLKNYLEEKDYFEYYQNDCVNITTASICEDPNILSVRQRNSDRELTLINNQLPLVPSGRLLMLLVINNFPLEIIKLVNKIIEESLLSPNEIYDIFNVNKLDEMPILYYALQQGEYLIVLALGRLIECLPEGLRKEVLDAKDDRGIPGLHMAMLGGHVSSIKAYGKLLELIPENQRAELLDIKNPTEDHIFFQAIKRGDKEAAIAFLGLLDYLLLLEEEEFIAATDKNGNSLLTLCLKTGGNIARDTFNAVLDSVKNNSENTAGQD